MKDYTTELDSIQKAITYATHTKRLMNTIMIDQHYYNHEISLEASNAAAQIGVLLEQLKKVEIKLVKNCDNSLLLS